MKIEKLGYLPSTAAFATSVGLAIGCYEAASLSQDVYNQGIQNGKKVFEESIGINGMQSAGLIEESRDEFGQTIYIYKPSFIPSVSEKTYEEAILVESLPYGGQETSADISTGVDQEQIKNITQEYITTKSPIPTLPQTSGFSELGSEDKTYMTAHDRFNNEYRNHVDAPQDFLFIDANMEKLDKITDITFLAALVSLGIAALTLPPKKQTVSSTS